MKRGARGTMRPPRMKGTELPKRSPRAGIGPLSARVIRGPARTCSSHRAVCERTRRGKRGFNFWPPGGASRRSTEAARQKADYGERGASSSSTKLGSEREREREDEDEIGFFGKRSRGGKSVVEGVARELRKRGRASARSPRATSRPQTRACVAIVGPARSPREDVRVPSSR